MLKEIERKKEEDVREFIRLRINVFFRTRSMAMEWKFRNDLILEGDRD